MKRFKALFVVVAVLFLCAGARVNAEKSFVISLPDGDLLLNNSGEPITQRGQYEQITPLDGVLNGERIYCAYPTLATQSVTLLDEVGKELSDGEYETVYSIGDGMLYTVKAGLIGAMDSSLNEILPCEYTALVYNGSDGFLALSSDPYDERPDGVYYVSMDDEESATGVKVFYGLGMFYEGLMPVVDASNNRMGYLNVHGEWNIPSQYEFAGEFINGVAEAALAAGSGFIDTAGNWLLTPKYAQVSRSGGSGSLILVQENTSAIQLIDAKTFKSVKTFEGEDVFFSAYYDIDMAVVYLDDCTLLLGPDGETVMECALDAEIDAWKNMNDRFILRQGEWGEKCVWLCDMSGKRLTDAYQDISYLAENSQTALFACSTFDVINSVDVDTAWYDTTAVDESCRIDVIDADAKVILKDLPYTSVQYDECGALIYTTPNSTGAIDLTGKTLCEFKLQ